MADRAIEGLAIADVELRLEAGLVDKMLMKREDGGLPATAT